eukprot:scaffold120140_cov74-Attheya_sp.AAC.1
MSQRDIPKEHTSFPRSSSHQHSFVPSLERYIGTLIWAFKAFLDPQRRMLGCGRCPGPSHVEAWDTGSFKSMLTSNRCGAGGMANCEKRGKEKQQKTNSNQRTPSLPFNLNERKGRVLNNRSDVFDTYSFMYTYHEQQLGKCYIAVSVKER